MTAEANVNTVVALPTGPPILMYHRICRDGDWRPSEFVVTATVFREQLRYLARAGYTTPRLSEVLAWNGRPPAGKNPVVLTFDDGYLDNLEVALPILEEFGFTASVFPVLDLEQRFPWWEGDPALRAPLLSAADMRAMESAGIEFGSHTMNHARLTRLDDDALADELVRSRETLASIVARPLPVLAYPYGEVDARVKLAVRQSGYTAALAVHTGPLELHADPLEIRRVGVTNVASDAYMKVTMSGAARLYRWLKWRAKEHLHVTSAAPPPRRSSSAS